MASVKLDRICKIFPKQVSVVKDVSFEVEEKEFLVLVGPSGCGKTTILRLIAGLEEITSGEIYIGGSRVNDKPPRDRDIAMVFQSYALYPHMNVRENLAFGLKLRHVSRPEIKQRVEEVSSLLGIEKLLNRKPKELSGGERQRVAIGRAIVRKPKVFLMDEPLSNLDAHLRIRMRAELKRLHYQLGITTIYVTHDQTEAMTLGQRIVVLKDGEIQQIASPLTLYKAPLNQFVAGFLGNPPMNFLPVQVMEKENRLLFQGSGMRIPVPPEKEEALRKFQGREILLGIRPEDIRLSSRQDSDNTFEARVELVEPLGAEADLHLTLDQQTLLVRASSSSSVKSGEKSTFSLAPRKIYCFHPTTGTAI